MTFKDGVWKQNLSEKDVDFLVRSNFQGWVQYLMNTYFKQELNLTTNLDLPSISLVINQEESKQHQLMQKFDSEIKDALKNADQKKNQHDERKLMELGETRSKLNKWFPV